jgi:hypothetical protein
MNVHRLDVVVLNEDMPAQGLRQGDLGTVVEIYAQEDLEVEFVTASSRTQALVTLPLSAVREVGDDDLIAVRPTHHHGTV